MGDDLVGVDPLGLGVEGGHDPVPEDRRSDVAEVLGSALAFKLLFGVSLVTGVLLTAFDTIIVLGLKGKGFRQIEAIILGLILTISICLFGQLLFVKPDWAAVAAGAGCADDVRIER